MGLTVNSGYFKMGTMSSSMTRTERFAAAERVRAKVPPAISRYMAANGAKGGAAGTARQREAHRRAIRHALAARQAKRDTIAAAARAAGLDPKVVYWRLRQGYSMEEALRKVLPRRRRGK